MISDRYLPAALESQLSDYDIWHPGFQEQMVAFDIGSYSCFIAIEEVSVLMQTTSPPIEQFVDSIITR